MTSSWCHLFMSKWHCQVTSFCHRKNFDLPSYWCQTDARMRSNWDHNLKIVSKKYQTMTWKWRLHALSLIQSKNDVVRKRHFDVIFLYLDTTFKLLWFHFWRHSDMNVMVEWGQMRLHNDNYNNDNESLFDKGHGYLQ